MIYEESRYETSPVVSVLARGEYHAMIFPEPIVPIIDVTTVIAYEGMRLDVLAGQVYGDAELWWRIADANPQFFYPDDIPPGAAVKVPRASALT